MANSFFLATTPVNITFTKLIKPQKLLLLSQLYANQLKGQFTIKHRDRKITLFGEVRELSRKEISIKTNEGYRLVQLDNILQIAPILRS